MKPYTVKQIHRALEEKCYADWREQCALMDDTVHHDYSTFMMGMNRLTLYHELFQLLGNQWMVEATADLMMWWPYRAGTAEDS